MVQQNTNQGHAVAGFPARRTVLQLEACAWLAANTAAPGTSVVTSLPDFSEMNSLDLPGWQQWFVATVRQIIRWLPSDGVAIFFQSDIRHESCWINKSHLVLTGATDENAALIWHKIVCRRPPGTIAAGRPTYSHMLCIAPSSMGAVTHPGPDVIADAGFMSWPRAMGENACRVACRFLQAETATRLVVDPFCGEGSVLAVANSFGFESVGIDLSARRCRAARAQNMMNNRRRCREITQVV